MGTVILQTICVLMGVCALAVVLLKGVGARFARPADSPMRVIGRLPLEPRRSLLVVRVGERALILASSEAGVSPIGEMDAFEAAALEAACVAPVVSRETLSGATHG